jgi:predicted DNA-binding antitoxin AbrB/MazE fold protein
MAITVEAIYENGVLKPNKPLPLAEHERVQVTIHSSGNWVQETAGMIRWTGDHETLRLLAEDVAFDPQEGA